MQRSEYATVSVDEAGLRGGTEDGRQLPLTGPLGCRETAVDAYRPSGDHAVALPADPENVCLPVDGPGELTVDESLAVPHRGAARVPAGVEGRLGGDEPVSWLVVSAAAESSLSARPAVVDVEACEFAAPSTSDIPTARLTDRLGCTGMKTNARLLEPGDRIPYHTEGQQEELFVPLRGPAGMRIDGETHRISTGSVVRVAPEIPRAAINDGDEEALWFMVGAPPTGESTGWDPGAEVVEWPGPE